MTYISVIIEVRAFVLYVCCMVGFVPKPKKDAPRLIMIRFIALGSTVLLVLVCSGYS